MLFQLHSVIRLVRIVTQETISIYDGRVCKLLSGHFRMALQAQLLQREFQLVPVFGMMWVMAGDTVTAGHRGMDILFAGLVVMATIAELIAFSNELYLPRHAWVRFHRTLVT